MARQLAARLRQSAAARKVGTALALAGASVATFAADTGNQMDYSAGTASVTTAIAGVVALGGAVFLLHLGIKSTKWGRKAL